MIAILGCVASAALALWGYVGDADFSTLLAHMLLKSKREKYRGKVIWITGASSGIGEELATVFARIGCKLVLSGTRREELERVRNKCEMINTETEVKIICGNVAETKQHAAWLQEVIDSYGKLDVLVNNAGRSQRSNFEKIPEEIERELFDVNVFAVMSLSRLAVNLWMRENKTDGEILVTSSTAGKLGAPFSATYCATKHALHGFFESLRSELSCKEFPVQITLACPGPVRSNIRVTAYTDTVGQQYNQADTEEQKNLLPTMRCAQLMVSGLANGLDELWICRQPVLLVYYLAQYIPSVFRMYLLRFFMNKNTHKLRDGR